MQADLIQGRGVWVHKKLRWKLPDCAHLSIMAASLPPLLGQNALCTVMVQMRHFTAAHNEFCLLSIFLSAPKICSANIKNSCGLSSKSSLLTYRFCTRALKVRVPVLLILLHVSYFHRLMCVSAEDLLLGGHTLIL